MSRLTEWIRELFGGKTDRLPDNIEVKNLKAESIAATANILTKRLAVGNEQGQWEFVATTSATGKAMMRLRDEQGEFNLPVSAFRKLLAPVLLVIAMLCATVAGAQTTVPYRPAAADDWQQAVVQIPSHGGSGTVIESDRGRTWIITAAHLFEGRNAPAPTAQIVVMCPPVAGLEPKRVTGRVKVIGAGLANRTPSGTIPIDDVAIVEVDDGPWPVVCPVADRGLRLVGLDAIRVGYPGTPTGQVWPAKVVPVRVTESSTYWTIGTPPPIPGDSGGGLIHATHGLIGVTSWRSTSGVGGWVTLEHIYMCLIRARGTGAPTPQGGPIRIIIDPTPLPPGAVIPSLPRLMPLPQKPNCPT